MRVGLVYDDTIDRYGGIGLYVRTLGTALARRGHHVELLVGTSVAPEADGLPVRSMARNVQVRFNGNVLSMPAWCSAGRLEQVLAAGHFDVLHVQVPYSPLMAGRLVRRAPPGCAVVGTYHVASDRLLPRLGARALRILKVPSAPRFDEMVSVSRTASAFASRWSGIDAPRIVPNMVDLTSWSRPGGVNVGGPGAEIVFVGRLVPRKGVGELINAAASLRERLGHGDTRISIIGDGPLRARLERQVRRLGLETSISFPGALDDEAKLAALAAAPIACFPSLYGESFGIVVLEALAAGAEVVLGGDNPGYAELLGDPRALIDPRDADAFAARLQALLADSELRRAIGGPQRALLRRFDADTVVGEVLAVYRSALNGRVPSVVDASVQEPQLAAA